MTDHCHKKHDSVPFFTCVIRLYHHVYVRYLLIKEQRLFLDKITPQHQQSLANQLLVCRSMRLSNKITK